MGNKNKYALVVVVILVLAGAGFVLFRAIRADNQSDPSVVSDGGSRPIDQEELKEELFAMDTVMDITLYRTADTDEPLADVFTELRDRIYQMEREFSVTDPDSEISCLNKNSSTGKWRMVSDDMWELLEQSESIAAFTGFDFETSTEDTPETKHAFDPTLYPIVKLWGFTTGDYRVPAQDEIDREMKKVGIYNIETGSQEGRHDVRLKNGAELDFGACAKGFLSDKLVEIMKAHHVNGILSLGGNVQTVGTKPDGSPFVVGIADPADGTSIYTTVEAAKEEAGIVTSGNYQRFFEKDGKRYHHIIDSRTGTPADNGIASVTLISDERGKCLYNDAYATAFFAMGEEKIKKFLATQIPSFEVIIIRNDGTSWHSEGVNSND